MKILPVLRKDFYKVGHKFQYENGTNLVYSNLTPRSTRIPNCPGAILFGPQWVVKHFFIDEFGENFFQQDRDKVIKAYKRRIDNALGPGTDVSHIGALHEHGHLPIVVKALPEGTLVPYRVPFLTIRNTVAEFYWLTNMLETLISQALWRPITSATTAFLYRKVFEQYARETGASLDFVKWQGHDFSMRGLDPDSSIVSGAAHLLSFTGTDTIPAIDFLEEYYGADSDKELIGGSVPATEHSVMCLGRKEAEFETFRRLITEVYPQGIVSIVSDTWDLWKVLTDYLPRLKETILVRNGKVVVRPDSGDPVAILCGDPAAPEGSPARLGVFRLLYKVFGGTTNAAGFIELDPHIGAIYGDSITPERQKEILSRMKAMGFASSNIVLGIGSFTYQYVTRDTHGIAMKATYGEVNTKPRSIFKDPATDDGVKKSARGLLCVDYDPVGKIYCRQDVDWNTEQTGLLQVIFRNGVPWNFQTLAQIRARVEKHINVPA